MDKYSKTLKDEIERLYEIAGNARRKHHDPADTVEALPAGGLAERVEGLVGPPGIAKEITRLRAKTDDIVPQLIDLMLDGKKYATTEEREKDAEQTVRTSLAVLTEGVVAAPIEGISQVKIKTNPDGSEYLSIYFSGPIRSAGGTAQGLAVLVGEYVRKKIGLSDYRPTQDEVERYIEEIKLYDEGASRLQYKPSESEVRDIVEKVGVCVDGDATEDLEVSIHRDLPRISSNRIRGGMCLVVAEGMAQKSRKIMKYAQKFGIDWNWLGKLQKTVETAEDEKPKAKFMDEVVGGRPIFSAPSAKGAFRLRYGHSRCNGIAAKSMNPATLILLDDFIATGTQVKVEKPGKGCVVTECDTIDGPIVRLKNGQVRRVDTIAEANKIKDELDEILFLGDILVTYGDFLQTNTRLVPSGYVEEWWCQESKGSKDNPTASEAVELCKTKDIPLHPRYTYYWADLTPKKIKELVDWLCTGKIDDTLTIPDTNGKKLLEEVGAPHTLVDGKVVISDYKPLLSQLGIECLKKECFEKAYSCQEKDLDGFELVKRASTVKLRSKSGVYIGCRMGRPEKAKERKMQPAVHGLFPIGDAGGRERSINEAVDKNRVDVEVSQFLCPTCKTKKIMPNCPDCGAKTIGIRTCICGYRGENPKCPKCGKNTRQYSKTNIDIKRMWEDAIAKIGKSTQVKGVVGMISENKIPEPIEKGLLRALNGVYVFKDGTIRFDATDVPLTHFRISEIGLSIEQAKNLGYEKDHLGQELTSEDQVCELRCQDIVVSEYCGTYIVKVARFTDQLLKKFYDLEPVYNIETPKELIGQLIVGLAPHTSAAIVGRIIGYTKANVCFAHPLWHAAKRRNADGDEDSIMLLMDVLLNFSRSYLPEKRGGKMDAPLVVTTIMNPKEVDDEAHKMEVGYHYSPEFYEKTLEGVNPSDVKVKIIKNILENPVFEGVGFTHDTGNITGPVTSSRYVTLKSMKEKIDAQLAVAEKIRAIDEREVAEIVINSHFLRDTYGNLRAFSRQHFRCVKCNANYRRIPLVGKCTVCGGKLLLTVSKGNITKYLGMSMELAKKYKLSDYLKARLTLLEKAVNSLTTNDKQKQVSLSDFM